MKVQQRWAGRCLGGAILPLIVALAGCGQTTMAGSTPPDQPREDLLDRNLDRFLDGNRPAEAATVVADSGISQSAEINQSGSGSQSSSNSSQSGGGGISQSTSVNQSSSGGGQGASVSSSTQTIDNGDGTVTIIETRSVNGKTETTRRTVKRSEAQQQNQTIQQRIEQR